MRVPINEQRRRTQNWNPDERPSKDRTPGLSKAQREAIKARDEMKLAYRTEELEQILKYKEEMMAAEAKRMAEVEADLKREAEAIERRIKQEADEALQELRAL
jgi:hypothetical protein